MIVASPTVVPVPSDEKLPGQVDVAIVGGGIAGACTAYYLARAGVSVVLCEKGEVGAEQSSRNWGWVRKLRRDPREIPLAIESQRLWDGLERELQAPTGYRRSGITFAARTSKEIKAHEDWMAATASFNLGVRRVAGAELDALVPGAGGRWKMALYCPTDGRAEPQLIAPAFALAARRLGGHVLTNCAVRGLEMSAGRVGAIVTERGRVPASTVVVAGGVWSRRFLKDLGLRLPQLKVSNTVMRIASQQGGPETSFWADGCAFGKLADGSGYLVADGGVNVTSLTPDSFRFLREFLPAFLGEWQHTKLRLDGSFFREWRDEGRVSPDLPSPYERLRILDPKPDTRAARRALERLGRISPAFRGADAAQIWAGMIDVTPDQIPVISPISTIAGLYVATGLSGHGFGVGPGVGRLTADLVLGSTPLVDPAPFAFERFSRSGRFGF